MFLARTMRFVNVTTCDNVFIDGMDTGYFWLLLCSCVLFLHLPLSVGAGGLRNQPSRCFLKKTEKEFSLALRRHNPDRRSVGLRIQSS